MTDPVPIDENVGCAARVESRVGRRLEFVVEAQSVTEQPPDRQWRYGHRSVGPNHRGPWAEATDRRESEAVGLVGHPGVLGPMPVVKDSADLEQGHVGKVAGDVVPQRAKQTRAPVRSAAMRVRR